MFDSSADLGAKSKSIDAQSEVLKDFDNSPSGGLIRDLFNRAAMPSDEKSCDVRPQSPLVAPLKDTCGIEVKKVYQNVSPSTFKVLNADFQVAGSAFYACSRDGSTCTFVTNYHVGKLFQEKGVLLQSNDQLVLGKMVAHSNGDDLALVEPINPMRDLKPVTFGAAPEKGDPVISVCNPTSKLNFPVVSAGKVLDPSGRTLVNDGNPMLSPPSVLTDQGIVGGCSGGADFNKNGEVIGVTRADGTAGTVAVKAEHVLDLLDKYEAKKKAESAPADKP